MAQTKINLTYIKEAINATQQLRSTVTNVFTFLCDGFKAEEDVDGGDEASTSHSNNISKDPKKFLFSFQNYLQAVNQDYNEVEKYCNSMTTTAEIPALGPSGYISQDSVLDKTGLYRNVWLTYQWFHKTHEFCQLTSSVMNSNSVRKSQSQPGQNTVVRKPRPTPQKFRAMSASSQPIDQILQSLAANQLKDSTLKIIQVSGDVRVVQIIVGRALNAFIVMRSFYIEQILVKGQGEDFYNENGTVDLFTSSQFESMRTITNHATSAIFEYYSPISGHPEMSIRYILHWLQIYKNLFTDKCSICGKHLFGGLPPLWVDYRSFVLSHDACRS